MMEEQFVAGFVDELEKVALKRKKSTVGERISGLGGGLTGAIAGGAAGSGLAKRIWRGAKSAKGRSKATAIAGLLLGAGGGAAGARTIHRALFPRKKE